MQDVTLPPPLLLADDPALDFLNSRARPGSEAVEWLGSGADLLVWLHLAGFVTTELADRLAAGQDPIRLDETARHARELRELLRDFVAAHAGAGLVASEVLGELGWLHAVLAQDVSHWRVLDQDGGLAWARMRDWHAPEALLQPLAEAAGRLIATVDFRTVRHCQGAGCTLWFRDTSRRQTRRWCSMALCGNRAKAAAHRARARAGAAGLVRGAAT